ncbi:SusC/RagA family TonB-linked outer membrane protein [Solitalea koreensis]|uniref:TonB-linked outer membrane protein, SusC/RagA family n=1 Tax=Solitalea koreensis TaxID=543615 RepID=A0A521C316_9SPHI|nr:TonB-dependent receptor [Solitalea koreensis]SMO53735.1 TonB-linked outer membrane protein, SusC/RagA family [Solitalea koreensis]
MKKNYSKVFTIKHNLKRGFRKESIIALMLLASSLNVLAQETPKETKEVKTVDLSKPTTLVKGRVSDEKNEALEGATVLVKGTNFAVNTDKYGEFTTRVPQGFEVLMISHLGMKMQEVNVKNKTFIKVSLESAIRQLDDIVVVAYGNQQKKDVVTAVSTIKAEEIMQQNQVNLGNALQGKIAGATIISSAGTPGRDRPTIMLRGGNPNTTNGSPYQPLLVVDGVPLYTDAPTALNSISLNGLTLEDINPDEVESISVLKDNAATAVYGTRGANGVILITTKRGKIGKPKFTYSTGYAVDKPTRFPKMLGGYQYALAQNEIDKNNNASKLTYSDADLDIIKNNSDPYKFGNTNMYDLLVQGDASQQTHSLSVNGGNEQVRYYINGSTTGQKGIINAYDYKRYTIQSNLDFKLTNDLKLAVNTAFASSKTDGANTSAESVFSSMFTNNPLTPIFNADGSLYGNEGANRWANINPGLSGYTINKSNNITAAANLEYSPSFINGLTFRLNNNINFNAAEYKNFFRYYNTYIPDATQPTGYLQKGGFRPNELRNNLGTATFFNTDFGFDYSKAIGKHRFGVMLLGTNYYTKSNSTQVFRDGIIAGLETISQGRSTNQTIGGTDTEAGKIGAVARVNYDFNNKYSLEASMRADASDNFPKAHRWGYFPGAAVAWRLSEENFIKDNVSFINDLKIRTSIGLAGIDNVSAYNYLYSYTLSTTGLRNGGGYAFNGTYQPAFALDNGSIPNPNLTWGKSLMRNIGLDFSLWKGLLAGTFDVWDKNVYDLPYKKVFTYPTTLGIDAPNFNFAKEYYKGFEASISNNTKLGKDMSLQTSLNLTYTYSRVVDYGEPETLTPANKKEGYSVTSNKYYKALGIFQTQEEIDAYEVNQDGKTPKNSSIKPGDIKYADLTGDGKITVDDQQVFNNTNIPPLSGGLNLTFRYKSLSLNAMLQGAGGNLVNFVPSNFSAYGYDNSWRPGNEDAKYPRLSTSSNNSPTSKPNTLYLLKGDYLRFKNLRLSYTVPAKLLKKTGLSNVMITAGATNLWATSRIKDIDPEVLNKNYNNGGYYPTQRNYSLGVTVGL